VGFGAMQLPGPRVFGPPPGRRQALDVLRHVVAGGVDHIDTAQFYGPDVANELIHAALHPYPPGLALVSKVGARHPEAGVPLGEQVAAMVAMRDEGLIGAVGLSTVTLAEYQAARALTEVACVQNADNLTDRSDQPLLDACADMG
jgi:aryl-alcohol dehydrogenase-like predicted oxidoreductase